MATANKSVQQALTAARAGDLATALKAYTTFENAWGAIEEDVRAESKDAYTNIEKAMTKVNSAFVKSPPDQNQVVATLSALDQEDQAFINR